MVYLVYTGELNCVRCNYEIADEGLFRVVWNSLERPKPKTRYGRPEIYCIGCTEHADKVSRYTVHLIGRTADREVIKCSKKLNGWSLYDIRPVGSLRSTPNNETVFTVADKQIGNEVTIDNTRLAGRESLEGASIGMSVSEAIAGKDADLKPEQLAGFFMNQIEGHPNRLKEVEGEEKKRLE